MGAEHIVDHLEADPKREQLLVPALLAGEIERRRMPLVLACAGVDQDRVARGTNHEGLIGDQHHAERGIEDLRLHGLQMLPEDSGIIGREETLRPSPRTFALDPRIDGDVPEPDLLHWRPPASFSASVTGARISFKARCISRTKVLVEFRSDTD